MKNKKYLITLLLIIALVFVFYSNNQKTENKDTIKIGISLPLSGNLSDIAANVREAMLIADEEINQNQNKYKYELVFEDDAMEAKKAALTANKLISVDDVDALISYGSTCGSVISAIAEQKEQFHIGIASDPNIANGKYSFIHWVKATTAAKKLFDELVKRGYTNVAIVNTKQSGVFAIADELKRLLDSRNIKYVEENVNPGEKDLKGTIERLKIHNPEIYIAILFSPTLEVFGKQLKEAGIFEPITSVYMFAYSKHKELFEGYWYIDSIDANKDFTDKIKQRTGESSSFAVGNAYDVIKIIYKAAEDYKGKGKPNNEYFANYIHNMNSFLGQMGRLTVDSQGIIDSTAVVKVIKKSNIELLKE